MTPPRKIPIAVPTLGDEEHESLLDPLKSGWLTQGPKVAEFERLFAARHEVAHALAVTSCTTGLHLALVGLGVGPGDEVIVPAFTWIATANVVIHCGATPVFVDVDERTFNIQASQVADAITPATRAIIAVHLFGLCADVDALREAAPGIPLVEDAACAVGAEVGTRLAGGLGDVASFSFHPRKIITTGEGGMVTTNDASLAQRLERLRNHGASVPEEARHSGPQPYLLPEFDVAGFNYRMTDLQGAVGVVQMGRLDALLAHRRRWAAWYTEALEAIPWLEAPSEPSGFRHSWQAYVTRVEHGVERNVVMKRLHEAGVATRPGTHAVTELGYYRDRFGTPPGGCPIAARLESSTMAIPLHGQMLDSDFEYVVDQLARAGG